MRDLHTYTRYLCHMPFMFLDKHRRLFADIALKVPQVVVVIIVAYKVDIVCV